MLHELGQPLKLDQLPAHFIDSASDPGFLALALADPNTVGLVDNQVAPNVLALCGCWTGVGFLHGNAAYAGLVVNAAAQIVSLQRGGWTCLSMSNAWVNGLTERDGRSFSRLGRTSYQFDRSIYEKRRDHKDELPKGYRIEPLREALFGRIHAELDHDFNGDQSKGLPLVGWVILKEDRCVSYVWGPVAGGIVEMGVVTAPEHRRLGLAAFAGRRLVDELLADGIVPHAGTNSTNSAAKRWAETIGFINPVEHDWIILNQRE